MSNSVQRLADIIRSQSIAVPIDSRIAENEEELGAIFKQSLSKNALSINGDEQALMEFDSRVMIDFIVIASQQGFAIDEIRDFIRMNLKSSKDIEDDDDEV